MPAYKYRTEVNEKDELMKSYKPILINMPITLLEQLDAAAKQLDLCRSEMLRRCLQRDLTFIADRQLHRFDEAKRSTVHDYAQWSSTILSETKE
jgi:metal-responsive CopG/Arc/MetJ family transcriptional regulator